MGDGFAVIAKDWTVQYLNPRAAELLLPCPADPRGHSLWTAFPALAGGAVEAPLRRTLEQGLPATCEIFYLRSQRWIEVRAWPSPLGMTCLLLDIHQRKLHERGLRDSTNRLQVALSAGRLGDWEWDARSGQVRLGRRAAEIFELPAEIPDHLAGAARAHRRRRTWRRSKPPSPTPAPRGATSTPNAASCSATGAAAGCPSWATATLAATASCAASSAWCRTSARARTPKTRCATAKKSCAAWPTGIPQLAWIAHSDGAMMWYNERWQAYTGMSSEDMLAGRWNELIPPDVLPAVATRWQESVQSGRPFEMEYPIRARDGQYRWFLTRANPMRDARGNLLRWFGTATDVDQVKRVQERLRDETTILELLNSTGSALAQQRELPALLQEVTDAATRIAGARFGTFFYQGARADGRRQALHAVSGTAPADFERLPHPQVRSGLAVPVQARAGEVVGTLFLGHPEPHVFNERTERIVGGIAAQAGIAIDNARMVDAAQCAAEEREVLLDRERYARTEAERSSQMKDEFLATLSHELRTPLTAILGWSQVLRRGNRSAEEQLRGLETIERNARAQAQLIEDLLDMGRITSGKVLLDMKLLEPAVVVDAALEAVRPAAEAKGIRLERDFTASGHVAADANRLQQVVWNLLSNALKFTPRGGAVRATIRAQEGHAVITVSDSGMGIRPEFLPHVFERFRQGDASTTRRHGGLGLGLSIVKHLVEQHGGTVAAASQGEGEGASFSVRLPLAVGEPRPQRMHLAPRSDKVTLPDMGLRDLGGLKVLLVDDEADARELVSRILRDCNCAVQTAANATEALALARSAHYDLLLSDIGMPDVDGFELLSRIRALGPARGGSVPAVALTAFARPQDRLRALESGFLDHVPKPIEPSELIATIARISLVSERS